MLKDQIEMEPKFIGAYSTTCKDWEDFNVIKAFNKALNEALKTKVNWL